VNQPALDELLLRNAEGAEDATDRIWRLLNLQIWGDIFITGRQPAPGAARVVPDASGGEV
jgi:asparagine synthase (glutamine-hydrolysing)